MFAIVKIRWYVWTQSVSFDVGKEWNKVHAVQNDSSIITSETGVSSHRTDCRMPSGDMKEKKAKKDCWTEPAAIWSLIWLYDDDIWWLVSLSPRLSGGPYTEAHSLGLPFPGTHYHANDYMRSSLREHFKCSGRRRNIKTFWGWVENEFKSLKASSGFMDLEISSVWAR